jgi:hypothetical protein
MTEHRDVRGYVTVDVPADHPLATKDGRVGRHRLVLWESLGRPTESRCALCGYRLPWKRADLTINAWRYVVNVDHINELPGDDRPENLQPLCSWCNKTRGQYGPSVIGWLAEVILRGTHPAERPPIEKLVNEFRSDMNHDLYGDDELARDDEPHNLRDGLIDYFGQLERIYDRQS